MNRKEYVFATVVFAAILYQHLRLRHVAKVLNNNTEIAMLLLDELEEIRVDEVFEDIVEEQLGDLE